MKISGPEKIILAVTAAFLVFAGGYFLGGRSGQPYSVEVQTVRTEETQDNAAVSARPGLVNINTATAGQLQSLPGIGAVCARDIVADREVNGPFRIPEELMRVPGIGEKTLSNILQYITVE